MLRRRTISARRQCPTARCILLAGDRIGSGRFLGHPRLGPTTAAGRGAPPRDAADTARGLLRTTDRCGSVVSHPRRRTGRPPSWRCRSPTLGLAAAIGLVTARARPAPQLSPTLSAPAPCGTGRARAGRGRMTRSGTGPSDISCGQASVACCGRSGPGFLAPMRVSPARMGIQVRRERGSTRTDGRRLRYRRVSPTGRTSRTWAGGGPGAAGGGPSGAPARRSGRPVMPVSTAGRS